MDIEKNHARKIIDLFENRALVAKAAGGVSRSTVDSWAVRGRVPQVKQWLMIANCEKYGVDKTEFFAVLLEPFMEAFKK